MYAINCIRVTYTDIDGTLVVQGYYRSIEVFKQWIEDLNVKRGAEYAKLSDYELETIEIWNI